MSAAALYPNAQSAEAAPPAEAALVLGGAPDPLAEDRRVPPTVGEAVRALYPSSEKAALPGPAFVAAQAAKEKSAGEAARAAALPVMDAATEDGVRWNEP